MADEQQTTQTPQGEPSQVQQPTEQQLSQPDTQTQTPPEGTEENTQADTTQNIEGEGGTTPPPTQGPTQEEYDKLANRLKEYELTEQEMSQLKNRLGVDSVDYETSQMVQALDVLQNQAQQEYIRLCNKYGVDYRPEAIEASSKALLEKDPKSYYELQTSLDRLQNSYEAKQQEVQNYAVTRDVNSFYSENAQLLQASPVLNNLINEYVSTTPQQYVNKASLNDLMTRAKSIYQEAFTAGMQYGKMNTAQNPGEVLNNSVATSMSQSYPTSSTDHIYTREELRKMSDADFLKNQKVIEQQMVKGLIKQKGYKMADNNFLRQVNTVPNFGVDLLFNANDGEIAVATHSTGHKIPVGKVILGIIYRNIENDLTSTSGTVLAKMGTTALGTAEATADIKGTSVVQMLATPVVVTSSTQEVNLTVATGALTAGTLDVVILYVQ